MFSFIGLSKLVQIELLSDEHSLELQPSGTVQSMSVSHCFSIVNKHT